MLPLTLCRILVEISADGHFGNFLIVAVDSSAHTYPEVLQGAHCELRVVTGDILIKLKLPGHLISLR